jgi:ATP-dependent helicase Lhr and Lhr-like helicase
MTTTSPSSGSSAERSEAFTRLHPALQRWIYDKGWTSLHDAQERAIPIVLAESQDLIISAATAAGKTEAAFLPICSVLASAERSLARGPDVLYVSPLKALINDQYDRLELMAGRADLVVHRWHGDVSASAKVKAADTAGGILLITPESLEAFLDRRGSEARAFLGRLRYVVIDELHSFLGNPRGAQLQSLLNRVELAARRRPPRIGLSATLGDMAVATTFLRPEAPTAPAVVVSTAEQELQLQVRGYRAPVPLAVEAKEDPATDEIAIAEHLFETVRGTDNLLFANSRRQVEIFANRLADLSAERRVPNEFWPHHGSLAKAVREEVEQQLKDRSRPVTAVCTSTLELGIDIGTVTSVAQIGPPPSVAALRQRLGRSGRRDDPAVIRIYVSEEELDARTALIDQLRCDLVQTIAMVDLLLDRWLESPADGGLNLSTLIQQTLALIAQHGGVMAADAHRVLCGPGPFENVDAATYAALLRDLAAADLIVQAGDGTLLHGPVGERFVNHYSFYAAFETREEWRLVVGGKTLGTMPIDHPVEIGGLLLFAGKRWRVVDVDSSAKVIELKPAAGGRPPRFGGDGPAVSGEVRGRMAQIYASEDVPAYLDAAARELLAEARSAWRRFGLAGAGAVTWDADTFLLPWVGDDTLWAMTLGLRRGGVDAEPEGPLLRLVGTTSDSAVERLAAICQEPVPDASSLAEVVENRMVEKWDWVLGAELSTMSYARRCLRPEAAWAAFAELAGKPVGGGQRELYRDAEPSKPATRSSTARNPGPPAHSIEFCVIDVETTGFSPRLGDRVVEVAAVRLAADGTILDEWSTLIDPQRDLGATHVHGIAAADLVAAPTFAQIAGDLLVRIDGAVVAAHNLRFDWGFLIAEYERAGHRLSRPPSICTIELGSRVLPDLPDRRLAGYCHALGIEHSDAHSAAADARATAGVLGECVRRVWDGRTPSLTALGCDPLTWPADMPALVTSGRVSSRGGEARVAAPVDYLARLVAGLDGHGETDAGISAYLQTLDRVLADRQLTQVEASDLKATAQTWGLDDTALPQVHRRYMATLCVAARSDGHVSDAERRDLRRVERLLGIDALDDLLG